MEKASLAHVAASAGHNTCPAYLYLQFVQWPTGGMQVHGITVDNDNAGRALTVKFFFVYVTKIADKIMLNVQYITWVC